jgi:MFS family permease
VARTGRGAVPWRSQAPIYAAGFFSNSTVDVASVVLPLWLSGLGASTWTIGLVVSARHVLPFLFSIHAGALMDRMGVRRFMIGCALMSAMVMPLFPASSWIPAAIVLQMINGYGTSIGWIGAQSCFGRVLAHSTTYSGRFSFAARMGSFLGPPAAGFAWDTFGPWGAFGVLGVWSTGIAISAIFVPPDVDGSPREKQKLTASDMMPRWSDYRDAWDLAREPAMRAVLLVTVLRIAASSIQDSFYPVWLHSIDMSATQIGLLITISSSIGAISSLGVGMVARSMAPMWVLIWTSFGSILFVSITPAFTTFLPLAIVAGLRGLCMGVSQPLMLSVLAEASGKDSLSRGAAVRTTANRVASATTPIAMGWIATGFGLATSFYVTGVVLALAMCLVALRTRRIDALSRIEA